MSKLDKKEVEKLATLLEKEGGCENASGLLDDILIPMAIKERLSLYSVMHKYRDSTKDQYSYEFQIHMALLQVGDSRLNKLDIFNVVTEKPS